MKKDQWELSDFVELHVENEKKGGYLENTFDIMRFELIGALRSYFNTYSHYFIKLNFEDEINSSRSENDKVKWLERLLSFDNYEGTYIENYTSLVIKLQHFFELLVKYILETCDPCLVLKPKNAGYINIISFLKGFGDDIENINSVEFSDAMQRLSELCKGNNIKKYCTAQDIIDVANILNNNKIVLQKMNDLRNRMLHRGKKVLSYKILDDFMTGEVMPLIKTLSDKFGIEYTASTMSEYEIEEKYSISNCINKMIAENNTKNLEYYGKIAVYKELCRCNFYIDDYYLKSYSAHERKENKKCPFCGRKTLRSYTNEDFNSDPYNKKYTFYECDFCTLKLEESIFKKFFQDDTKGTF